MLKFRYFWGTMQYYAKNFSLNSTCGECGLNFLDSS